MAEGCNRGFVHSGNAAQIVTAFYYMYAVAIGSGICCNGCAVLATCASVESVESVVFVERIDLVDGVGVGINDVGIEVNNVSRVHRNAQEAGLEVEVWTCRASSRPSKADNFTCLYVLVVFNQRL